MALMDEFKEERENMKNAPLKTKIAYIWQYYKWHIIIPLAIISFFTWYITYLITKPDILLEGIFLNAHSMEASTLSEELAADFCEQHEIDTKDYEINLNTSLSFDGKNTTDTTNYETIQVLMAWLSAGTVDFIAGDTNALTALSYRNYLVDLREVLSEEELKKYEPYFLYIDEAVLYSEDEAVSSTGSAETKSEYPDCTRPEEMERPIPVLIDMSECEAITQIYPEVDQVVFGVAVNASNLETLSDFLEYLQE